MFDDDFCKADATFTDDTPYEEIRPLLSEEMCSAAWSASRDGPVELFRVREFDVLVDRSFFAEPGCVCMKVGRHDGSGTGTWIYDARDPEEAVEKFLYETNKHVAANCIERIKTWDGRSAGQLAGWLDRASAALRAMDEDQDVLDGLLLAVASAGAPFGSYYEDDYATDWSGSACVLYEGEYCVVPPEKDEWIKAAREYFGDHTSSNEEILTKIEQLRPATRHRVEAAGAAP